MAQLPLSYNTPENNEGLTDFTALPADKYVVHIVKSEYKETKAKTGHYLQLQQKVISGKYKGRLIFENLNLDNPNPTAVEIANKALNSICKACKKAGVQDSEELHGIPFYATLKVNPATATQPASNQVVSYSAIEDGANIEIDVSAESTPASNPDATSTPKEGKKLPWE
jgi:hypothetical protein